MIEGQKHIKVANSDQSEVCLCVAGGQASLVSSLPSAVSVECFLGAGHRLGPGGALINEADKIPALRNFYSSERNRS